LILGKISKIGDTRCQILRLKCTKFDFRWGSVPDPAGGAYSAPPDPLAVFKEPASKGMGWRGKVKGWELGKVRWRGREGKGVGLEGPPISCWHRAPRRVNPALHRSTRAVFHDY